MNRTGSCCSSLPGCFFLSPPTVPTRVMSLELLPLAAVVDGLRGVCMRCILTAGRRSGDTNADFLGLDSSCVLLLSDAIGVGGAAGKSTRGPDLSWRLASSSSPSVSSAYNDSKGAS
jgi:hypothetical protein